jgi:ubiquitin C-terminal hydrolase
MALAPGHSLRDFLHDDRRLTPPPALPSPPRVQLDTGETYGPPNRPLEEQALCDRKVPGSVPGICGLLNMGNTCYMNAGLQCIRSIPEIALHYLNSDDKQSTDSQKGALSSRLATLLHKLWSGLFSAVHPQAFKITLGLLHPQFNGNRQQDCQEFLAMLLDTLHEDCVLQSNDRLMTELSDPSHNQPIPTRDDTSKDCITEHGSVITQTFRGMLKNEVVCQKCGHKSTKEEPFFYLSVSLPHAFDRQIYVQWMPLCLLSGTRKSVRLLVTVSKIATIAVFKRALVDLIGRPLSNDLVQIAEIKENTIIRVLADSVALKQMDDDKCEIFAFELSPLPNPPDSEVETEKKRGEKEKREGEGERKSEGEMDQGTDGSCVSGRKHSKESDSDTEGLPTKLFKSEEQSSLQEGISAPAPLVNAPNEPASTLVTDGENDRQTYKKEDVPVISKAVVMEWHSCAICLEEMIDSDLVTHATCGAVLCPSCLQSSVDHYQKEEGLVPCPICSAVVKSSEAFTPLAQQSESSNLIKLLQTTVLFRSLSSEDGLPQCVSPPAVLRLPESLSGLEYHRILSPLLPPSLAASSDTWNLSLTDSKGRFCSRCMYGSGCRGCVISRDASSHSLRPGDFLTVTLVGGEAGEICEEVQGHPSLATKRDSILSLEECLSVFSQREELVGDNIWFCPSCEDFQPATRVLSVSSLPQTLIIHLKRFMYHGTAGSKVDAPVTFPLELDPRLVSHDCHVTESLALAACVCHFGSLNCGHYTAYVKHMVTEEWTYCNDETVTTSTPSDKDSESVYILFYRRRDLPPVPTLPPVTMSFNAAAEMSSLTRLLRQHKPRPSDIQPVPPRTKRSNSDGDLRTSSSTAITSETNQLLASLGINPASATIATTLPQVSSIVQVSYIIYIAHYTSREHISFTHTMHNLLASRR